MTTDEMLELVETVDKAILPLGYEVITGHEEGDIFNLVLAKREKGEEE